eukprot:UN14406
MLRRFPARTSRKTFSNKNYNSVSCLSESLYQEKSNTSHLIFPRFSRKLIEVSGKRGCRFDILLLRKT